VFVLAEGGFGFDSVDVPARGDEHGFDVAAVFLVVDASEVFPDGAVRYFVRNAFENDGFVGEFGADGAMSVSGDIFCFARVRAGAEPERVFPPDTPNNHEMRAAVRTCGGDPVVMRFFETFESPAPRLETLRRIRGHVGNVGPVGAARSGFAHDGLRERNWQTRF